MADISAFKEPFTPRSTTGMSPEAATASRIAYALEYMAAQMGEMNAKLDKFIEGDARNATNLVGIQNSLGAILQLLSRIKF